MAETPALADAELKASRSRLANGYGSTSQHIPLYRSPRGRSMGAIKPDRVSPPLMHAFRSAFTARDAKKRVDLRDEAGERVISSRMLSKRSAITEPTLRQEVARDLDGLTNTIALESSLDLGTCDHVRRSILNYGLPDIAHRSIDDYSVTDLKDEIRTVLMQFEPRLLENSTAVARDTTIDPADLKLRFVVSADLWCEPVNVPIEFVADLELDSGKIRIQGL